MSFDLVWLQRRFPARELHWYGSIDSTMTEATRLAAAGCPDMTVVGADEQRAGVGRQGHLWHSEADAGLYVSLVIRRTLPADAFPAVTLALGLATREAIHEATGVSCDLRWPNDLLIGTRKCCGILVNLESSGALVAGIGINVNHDGFPEPLDPLATSLRMASGRIHPREPLMAALLNAVDRRLASLATDGISPTLADFTAASSYVTGRRVIVDESTTGTTAGLDAQGFLLLACDNEQTVRILAGGVRPL